MTTNLLCTHIYSCIIQTYTLALCTYATRLHDALYTHITSKSASRITIIHSITICHITISVAQANRSAATAIVSVHLRAYRLSGLAM